MAARPFPASSCPRQYPCNSVIHGFFNLHGVNSCLRISLFAIFWGYTLTFHKVFTTFKQQLGKTLLMLHWLQGGVIGELVFFAFSCYFLLNFAIWQKWSMWLKEWNCSCCFLKNHRSSVSAEWYILFLISKLVNDIFWNGNS